jgi:WD40 repeat protein
MIPIDSSFSESLNLSLSQAGNRVEDYMGRYQPMRIGHIALLKEDSWRRVGRIFRIKWGFIYTLCLSNIAMENHNF